MLALPWNGLLLDPVGGGTKGLSVVGWGLPCGEEKRRGENREREPCSLAACRGDVNLVRCEPGEAGLCGAFGEGASVDKGAVIRGVGIWFLRDPELVKGGRVPGLAGAEGGPGCWGLGGPRDSGMSTVTGASRRPQGISPLSLDAAGSVEDDGPAVGDVGGSVGFGLSPNQRLGPRDTCPAA